MAERGPFSHTSRTAIRLVCCLLAGGLTGEAAAQSYVDRNFSTVPAAREAQRPIIVSPVIPAPPPPQPAARPHQGPVGSYASDAAGQDIRVINTDYATVFPVIHRLPPGSLIRDVAWRYGVSRKPPGFEAVLCWKDADTCWTVSGASSGHTAFFNGKEAAQPFVLYYRVRGKTSFGAPVTGAMNQVIVTYDIPVP